jgi:hypothetical protein
VKLPIIILAAATCAPTYSPTHTKCELILGGNWDGTPGDAFLSIQDLREAEARFLEVAATMHDKTGIKADNACSMLHGVKVFVAPTVNFTHPWTLEKVSGYANCDGRNLVIGSPTSGRWQESSLAHELFHIAQGCQAVQPATDGQDSDHANWVRDGITQAIMTMEDPLWNP